VVNGAEIPPPFGGKYRQVMVYVDPFKLLSRQLSVMDVVDGRQQEQPDSPAGDVKMGPYDYYVYSNSLVDKVDELNSVPIKTAGGALGFRLGCWGGEGFQPDPVQHRARSMGSAPSYLPIMKQGGDHQYHRRSSMAYGT